MLHERLYLLDVGILARSPRQYHRSPVCFDQPVGQRRILFERPPFSVPAPAGVDTDEEPRLKSRDAEKPVNERRVVDRELKVNITVLNCNTDGFQRIEIELGVMNLCSSWSCNEVVGIRPSPEALANSIPCAAQPCHQCRPRVAEKINH